MPVTTLYEVLNIEPTATVEEIQVAYDGQYNHWRRLVTHHDPDMVNKANQALRWLEKAQATLLDPVRRLSYDAQIGVGQTTSGLADPEAIFSAPGLAAPSPKPPAARTASLSQGSSPVDAWVCPKCNKANPLGTPFCNQCGQKLGRKCPKCGTLTQAIFAFCSACGVNMDEYLGQAHQASLQAIKDQLSSISSLISTAQSTRKISKLAMIEQEVISVGKKATTAIAKLEQKDRDVFREQLDALLRQAQQVIVRQSKRKALFF